MLMHPRQGTGQPLLEVQDLTVQYPGLTGSRRRPAVRDLYLAVHAGESVGLVGAAGSGKSTVVRALTGQVSPRCGRITFAGQELLGCSASVARRRRRAMHVVEQDPYASLPPNRTVGAILAEPLRSTHLLTSRPHDELVREALELVRLTPVARYLGRYPHQLSGGERQRVTFASALITQPRLVLADEPTQMLDESLRDELVDLLDGLRTDRQMAVVHITNDLELVRRGCDRLVVLRGGKIIEQGRTEQVLCRPEHPYTADLVAEAGVRLVA
ncbi:MAG TPA: ABC transporter ATP-binding protein [Pseudonocardia sp.]|jgi:peptide/nickel transport system ATP-binding protein|uniref:ABC transporter ATP-binding protein n=1 Tax=Pseudonocardia sp. TaxID=60912 RepID=UPI002F408878